MSTMERNGRRRQCRPSDDIVCGCQWREWRSDANLGPHHINDIGRLCACWCCFCWCCGGGGSNNCSTVCRSKRTHRSECEWTEGGQYGDSGENHDGSSVVGEHIARPIVADKRKSPPPRCFRGGGGVTKFTTVLVWLGLVFVTITLSASDGAAASGEYSIDARGIGNNVHNYRHSIYGSDSDDHIDSDRATDNDDDVDDDDDDDDDEIDENDVSNDFANVIDGRLSAADIGKLHQIVLQGLRLKRIPDVANMNVSHTEYAHKYTEYLDAVRRREAREAATATTPRDFAASAINSKKLYTFSATNYTSDSRHLRRKRSIDDVITPTVHHLRFALTKDTVPTDIDEAILSLLIRCPSTNSTQYSEQNAAAAAADTTIDLRVYHTVANHRQSVVANHTVHMPGGCHSRWLNIDLMPALAAWTPIGNNFHLEVHTAPTTVGHWLIATEHNAEPLLSIVGGRPTQPAVRHRAKRSRRQHRHFMQSTNGGGGGRRRSRKTDCNKDNQKCCRHTMDVVFKEIKGFEFIIQPKNFDAGYCRGRCPPRYNPAHHHAVLQSMIWKQDRSKAPRPCCAPSKLVELEVLHVDEMDGTKLKVSTWSDMRVLDCACS